MDKFIEQQSWRTSYPLAPNEDRQPSQVYVGQPIAAKFLEGAPRFAKVESTNRV